MKTALPQASMPTIYKQHLYNMTPYTLKYGPGVPDYLAPWTACPPGGKLSRDILPPALVILTPGGQAVQAGLSCPPAHIKKILLCDVYFYLQHYNNYMQFLSYNYVNLNDYFKHSVGFLIDKGWRASCPGWFILPPT